MDDANRAVARIAAAIGEPARVRILYSLMDHRARTATELAAIAGVSASTASAHLNRLDRARLIAVQVQGRHRYYHLAGTDVARTLERLSILAGARRAKYVSRAPDRLRFARTCYDHIAGTLGVALHDAMRSLEWVDSRYRVTPKGTPALEKIGANLERASASRRRFAFGCLDWTERRSHLGGALGAELFRVALANSWVVQDADSRALAITHAGRREMLSRFELSGSVLL